MALIDLTDWLNEFSGPQYAWLVKRLSGNDTLANRIPPRQALICRGTLRL